MSQRRFRLPEPCLMLVTDRRLCPGLLEDAVAQAVAGGVNAVQLRLVLEYELTTESTEDTEHEM